jgi:hypothetical protein
MTSTAMLLAASTTAEHPAGSQKAAIYDMFTSVKTNAAKYPN